MDKPHYIPAELDLDLIQDEAARLQIIAHFKRLWEDSQPKPKIKPKKHNPGDMIFIESHSGNGRLESKVDEQWLGPRSLWEPIIRHGQKDPVAHAKRCREQYEKRFAPRHIADGLSLYPGIELRKEYSKSDYTNSFKNIIGYDKLGEDITG